MRWLCLATLTFALSYPAIAQQSPEPTKQHELLKRDVGTWTGTMKVQIPNADPMEIPAKETNKMLAGDLWLLSEFESGPFHGRGHFGYDTNKKKFVGTWVDNSSTQLNMMSGSYDKAKGEMTMTFKGLDATSGKMQEMKTVSSFDGDDKRNFVMYTKQADEWVKSFEIEYHRSK